MPSSTNAQELNAASRAPITAFVVSFNEEEDIEACLESLSFCDEVIVIDSHSTDATPELCRTAGAKLIQRDWPGYVKQKAFGLAESSHQWVLNLDADERVSPELQKSIIEVLEKEHENEVAGVPRAYNGYQMNRVVYFLGRWWRSGGWYPEYRVRFLRKDCTTWGGSDPHEKPIVSGRIGRLDGELEHYTYRSLAEQIEQLHRFSSIVAEQEYRAGKRAGLRLLLLNPILRMLKFYVVKRGFVEGVAGLVVAINEGFYTFMKYAKLWELEHRELEHGELDSVKKLAEAENAKPRNEGK